MSCLAEISGESDEYKEKIVALFENEVNECFLCEDCIPVI